MRRAEVEVLIKNLPANQRPPWERTSASYVFAREKWPTGRISTGMTKVAWNELHAAGRLDSRASMNAISRYLGWARVYHDPEADESPLPASDRPLPAAVQQAMDAVRTPLERLGNVILDAMSQETAEAMARAEATLVQERSRLHAKLHEAEGEIDDRHIASIEAAEEFESTASALEELRASFQALEIERDAALARAEYATQTRENEQVKLSNAQQQLESLRVQIGVQVAELQRLQEEREGLKVAAQRAAGLEIVNAGLRERIAVLTEEIGRCDARMAESDQRHAREREEVRAHYEQRLADEQRRVALLEAHFDRAPAQDKHA